MQVLLVSLCLAGIIVASAHSDWRLKRREFKVPYSVYQHSSIDRNHKLTPFGREAGSRRSQWAKPVKQFIYHALRNIPSSAVSPDLHRFCRRERLREYGLRCLSRELCGPEWSACVEEGDSLTLIRLNSTCCPAFTAELAFDAVIDPVPLDRASILRLVPGAFRFTLLQEPLSLFLHHYKTLFTADPLPPLPHLVQSLYQAEKGEKRLQGDLGRLQRLLNSQSRDLGWDGLPDSLPDIIRVAKSLDFLGSWDQQSLDWLRTKLRWPADMFKPVSKTEIIVDAQLRKMILELQWADARLYELTKSDKIDWNNIVLQNTAWRP